MSAPQVQRLLEEWRRSRRLRLGALVVLAILGAHAALALSDAVAVREEAFRRDTQLLGKLEEASREAAWPARAAAAEAALAETRHSIPPATSDGLAQAEMQAWLTDLAVYAGIAGPTIRVETSLPVPGQPAGTWQVLARLDGQASPAAVPVLVRALTSALPWIRTERLELVAGEAARMSLVVRGYYRQADPLDAKEPPARPAELPAATSTPETAQPTRNPLAPPVANPLASQASAPSASQGGSRRTAQEAGASEVAPDPGSKPSRRPRRQRAEQTR